MELKVLKVDGSDSGEKVKLPNEVFGVEPNHHLIYQAVFFCQPNLKNELYCADLSF